MLRIEKASHEDPAHRIVLTSDNPYKSIIKTDVGACSVYFDLCGVYFKIIDENMRVNYFIVYDSQAHIINSLTNKMKLEKVLNLIYSLNYRII